jgi:hypothetical protein
MTSCSYAKNTSFATSLLASVSPKPKQSGNWIMSTQTKSRMYPIHTIIIGPLSSSLVLSSIPSVNLGLPKRTRFSPNPPQLQTINLLGVHCSLTPTRKMSGMTGILIRGGKWRRRRVRMFRGICGMVSYERVTKRDGGRGNHVRS